MIKQELLNYDDEAFKMQSQGLFSSKIAIQEHSEKIFNPYVNVTVNYNKIYEKLQDSKKQNKKSADKRSLKIIENGIKASFFGYDNNTKIKDWNCNIGETLHIKVSKVYQVVVYEKMTYPSKLEKVICFLTPFLKERLHFQYKKICCNKLLGPSSNFPQWLELIIINNSILIKLSPKRANVGEYIISFKNFKGYTIYSFGVVFVFPKSPSMSPYNTFKKVTHYNLSEANPTVLIPEEDQEQEEDDDDDDDNEYDNEKESSENIDYQKKYRNSLKVYKKIDQNPFSLNQSPLAKLNLIRQKSITLHKSNSQQNKNQIQSSEWFPTQTNFTNVYLRQPQQELTLYDIKQSDQTVKSALILKTFSKTLNSEQSNLDTMNAIN